MLPQIKYCITLDSDTRLPRDVARELIGIITHPLNRATFDPRVGRVTEGYGILQPRVSVTFMSAAGSLFARLYSGHTGVDPYTTAVSDTYQDLFGEGIFTGKGLYDVDAFTAALEDSVPENALLSHDLFEGLHARVALVSDVELVDEYPSSVLSHARRQHRWIRGDWQILFWLFPFVPSPRGLKRNTLPLIGRWKILDNLRRSLVSPTLLVLLVAGWTVLPGPRWFWTMTVMGVAASQLLPVLARLLVGPGRAQSIPVFLRNLRRDAATALAQILLSVTFLAFHAFDTAHAIGVTSCASWSRSAGCSSGKRRRPRRRERPGWSGRGCADSSPRWRPARSSPPPSPLAIVARDPGALPAAAPFLFLWIDRAGRGLLAQRAGRRTRPAAQRSRANRAAPDGAQDVALLRDVRHRSGRLAASRQLSGGRRRPKLARRTSPTNIGMSLLSTLAAHDLGYLSTDALRRRLDATLDDARGSRAISRTLPELVRHGDAWRRCTRATSRPSTAATSPAR